MINMHLGKQAHGPRAEADPASSTPQLHIPHATIPSDNTNVLLRLAMVAADLHAHLLTSCIFPAEVCRCMDAGDSQVTSASAAARMTAAARQHVEGFHAQQRRQHTYDAVRCSWELACRGSTFWPALTLKAARWWNARTKRCHTCLWPPLLQQLASMPWCSSKRPTFRNAEPHKTTIRLVASTDCCNLVGWAAPPQQSRCEVHQQ
jgi:hypothetical protein